MKTMNTIRKHRERAGWTQVQLAERAGIAWRTVQDLERGVSAPTLASMRGICKALDMPPEILWPEDD